MSSLKFIEMTGTVLQRLLRQDELSPDELKSAGVTAETIVRINHQGDIEVRRADRWDVIGGLIGEFDKRIKKESGLDWA